MNTADITIVFTSSYSGSHRICYRVLGDTNYTCIISNCSEGEECSFTFPIDTINNECDALIIEGYIQPLCEDLSSDNNKIPWQVDLFSTNPCKKYSIDCSEGFIGSVTVLNSGTAVYDPLNPPNLIISETNGNGLGAIVTPIINNTTGLITGVSIDSIGSLYGSTTIINVDSGTGTLPTFRVVVQCNSSIELPDCSDSPQVIPTLTLGTPYQVCTSVILPSDYLDDDSDIFIISRQETSCLCNCISYSVNNTSPFLTLPFRYYDCDGVYHIVSLLPSSTTVYCIGTYGTYLLSNFIHLSPLGSCS